MLALAGIGVIVFGFAVRANPLLVVALAGLVTGIASGRGPVEIIALFGKAFNDNRYIGLIWLVLPVVGLLERAGLQERARGLAARLRISGAGRLLLVYFVFRQATSALGLTALGGHAQMVRPLVAPMAEEAARRRAGTLTDDEVDLVRAHAAAADNLGLAYGEDIFVAIASVLLIKGFLAQNGIALSPFALSVWAIPSALAALAIHGVRLWRLDVRLRRPEPPVDTP